MSRLFSLAAATAAALLCSATGSAQNAVPPTATPDAPPTLDDAAASPQTIAVAAGGDEVDTITVAGKRRALTADLPQTSFGVTASELQLRLFVNTEDALKHIPSVGVRKRYVGDRNALLSGRSFNALQAPRGVVYSDGVLLSNFLGRFNAPRWNMVAPEEVSRVDVLYGPYSALYPGNSIGTTVLVTTRDPAETALSGRLQAFTEHFSEYGVSGDFGGEQLSLFGGGRRGRWSGTLGANRLRSDGHPMQYATGTLVGVPTDAQNAAAVDVTGAIPDKDPRGLNRLILGPNGQAREDDVQDQIKPKVVYENEAFRADAQLAFWRNEYDRDGKSLLRDAAGNTVTRGTIRFQDRVYTVADSSFGPQTGTEQHLMTAVTARTKHESGWNFSAVTSIYDIDEDRLRSNVPTGSGATQNLEAGTIVDGGSGKGWWNVDVQATYGRDDLAHAFTFGYYRSRYELDQERYATAEWRHGSRGALLEDAEGATVTQALYAQDVWKFAQDWSVTAGARFERWQALDGLRANATKPDGLRYDDRREEDVSPKLSIAYAPPACTLRYSIGRGLRYPTVSELFQGSIGTTIVNGQPQATIQNNDPDLEAEDALSQEIAWEKTWARRHKVRVSLFRDDIDDTVNFQTDVNVTPNITNIQNVDRVLTQGVELVYGVVDLLPDVDLDANLSLVDSEIRKNERNPASVGKDWVRIPHVRANLIANWRFLPGWNANVASLHVGKNYGELDNSDEGGCRRFGCTSKYTTVDARVGYTWRERYEFALGVSNLTDAKYYEFHPYPQRTLLAQFRGHF